jgi:hypothetical protein
MEIKKLEKDMGKFKSNKEGKTDVLKVKPFSFFRSELVSRNGSLFTDRHIEVKGGTTEADRERENSTERNTDGNA